jgi:hypothetical protein
MTSTFRARFKVEETPKLESYPVVEGIKKGKKAQGLIDGGPVSLLFIAPIDLKPEDVCTVNIRNGEVFKVERGEEAVYRKKTGFFPPTP